MKRDAIKAGRGKKPGHGSRKGKSEAERGTFLLLNDLRLEWLLDHNCREIFGVHKTREAIMSEKSENGIQVPQGTQKGVARTQKGATQKEVTRT
jgi:hypothetical protein